MYTKFTEKTGSLQKSGKEFLYMKVLVIYCDYFSYNPSSKTLKEVDDVNEGAGFDNCIAAFIQIEKEDEEKDISGREKKLVNHLRWTARKNNTMTIVLHSFAHLSDSRASVNYTKSLLDQAEKRLKNSGYLTRQTPFGYFLDLDIKAPGNSLARIWAAL